MTEVTGGGGTCNSTCLSSLVHDFHGLGSCGTTEVHPAVGNADAESSAKTSEVADQAMKAAKRITRLLHKGMAADPFVQRLASDVAKATQEMVSLRSSSPAFRREVASRLREGGYDAAVCQTRWRATQDILAGNYEYIDVVTPASGKAAAVASSERYIVDVAFASEFVVARPTTAYNIVLEALPMVLVAGTKVVQQVVKVAAKAARCSLKTQGLTVPPWRKKRFMAAKWFGPHHRTADTAMGARVASVTATEAICPTVGFLLGPPAVPPCF